MNTHYNFKSPLRRENGLKWVVFRWFMLVASPVRLTLEVFVRRNFGQRYFKLSSALFIVILLGLWPWGVVSMSNAFSPRTANAYNPFAASESLYGSGGFSDLDNLSSPEAQAEREAQAREDNAPPSPWRGYITWYIFLAGILAFSVKHHLDIRRQNQQIYFRKYSLYDGDINPLFYRLKLFGKAPDERLIACVYEPAFFFILGLLLALIGQSLGTLLILCSIAYCIGYVGDYAMGDSYVLDMIDKMIMNKELKETFVDSTEARRANGLRIMADYPNDPEVINEIYHSLTKEDEPVEARPAF